MCVNTLYQSHFQPYLLIDRELIDLLLEFGNQLVAFDELVAEIVFYAVRPVHLPADIAGDQGGVQSLARRVDCRSHPSGPAPIIIRSYIKPSPTSKGREYRLL